MKVGDGQTLGLAIVDSSVDWDIGMDYQGIITSDNGQLIITGGGSGVYSISGGIILFENSDINAVDNQPGDLLTLVGDFQDDDPGVNATLHLDVVLGDSTSATDRRGVQYAG